MKKTLLDLSKPIDEQQTVVDMTEEEIAELILNQPLVPEPPSIDELQIKIADLQEQLNQLKGDTE